jgi:drug/metabolite transporter (DMT)-like permease
MKFIPFILFTVLTNAAAQLMLKQGMTNLSPITLGSLSFADDTLIGKLGMTLLNPWVMAGLIVFVISMASHLFVLSKVEISFAYPFLSLAYIVVAVAAWTWFGEDLNQYRVAGIAMICVGTILIAQGGDGKSRATSEPETLTQMSEATKQ